MNWFIFFLGFAQSAQLCDLKDRQVMVVGEMHPIMPDLIDSFTSSTNEIFRKALNGEFPLLAEVADGKTFYADVGSKPLKSVAKRLNIPSESVKTGLIQGIDSDINMIRNSYKSYNSANTFFSDILGSTATMTQLVAHGVESRLMAGALRNVAEKASPELEAKLDRLSRQVLVWSESDAFPSLQEIRNHVRSASFTAEEAQFVFRNHHLAVLESARQKYPEVKFPPAWEMGSRSYYKFDSRLMTQVKTKDLAKNAHRSLCGKFKDQGFAVVYLGDGHRDRVSAYLRKHGAQVIDRFAGSGGDTIHQLSEILDAKQSSALK